MKNPFVTIGNSILFTCLTCIFVTSCQIPMEDIERSYDWFEFSMINLDTATTGVDMSFLNPEPAGKSGYITVKDGHFADGEGNPIRFFGTNVTFANCFPEKETASKIAVRLKKLGFNVMRFHHMDMQAVPRGIWKRNMMEFDPEQLDKLDWFISELKKNGIYINLNMHVSRNYPGPRYEHHHFNFGKSIDQFYQPYIEMQKNYAHSLLGHFNPYTGTTYLEEPAVAFVEVNNENSLLSNWWLLPELKDEHRSALNKMWKEWLKNHPEYKKEIAKNPDLFTIAKNLKETASVSEKEMFWGFLVDTEMAYTKEMTEYIKNKLKSPSLISQTQSSYSGVAGVFREAKYADFVDQHSYWEHPAFPGAQWSSSDWLIRNTSMVASKTGGTLLKFGQHRTNGMPLTISEYDHPAPNDYCAEMYPMLNSVAAFQNWDGIYHFDLGGGYESGRITGFFSSTGHPLKQIFIPVGTVLFRMKGVSTGERKVQLNLPEKSLMGELIDSGDRLRLHSSNMNVIWEKAGASPALIVQRPMEVVIGGDELTITESGQDASEIWKSDNGQISWDNREPENAVFTVNAPTAKIAVGYIGEKNIELGEITISMDKNPNNWACVSLVSLDGKPTLESEKMLLVVAGKAENTDMKWNENRTSVGTEWGEAPVLVEGLPGLISFRKAGNISIQALNPAGNPFKEIKTYKTSAGKSIALGAQNGTLWYIISR